jgi:hypothetical protein
MSDFLTSLVARSLDQPGPILPRPHAPFEDNSAGDVLAGAAEELSTTSAGPASPAAQAADRSASGAPPAAWPGRGAVEQKSWIDPASPAPSPEGQPAPEPGAHLDSPPHDRTSAPYPPAPPPNPVSRRRAADQPQHSAAPVPGAALPPERRPAGEPDLRAPARAGAGMAERSGTPGVVPAAAPSLPAAATIPARTGALTAPGDRRAGLQDRAAGQALTRLEPNLPPLLPDPARPPDTPVIQVTIGRVEVRTTPAPRENRAPSRGPKVSTLEDYLRGREGGR